MSGPLAYFITFHTYGSWLHGRAEGSIDHDHRAYGQPIPIGNPRREDGNRDRLKFPAFRLDETRREAVLNSILETCRHRQWNLHALHVRQNHVHLVITSPNTAPEKVLRDIKAYATRHLRRQNLLAKEASAWSEHGSTRYLWAEDQVAEKCGYTLHEQGAPVQHWPA
ncbi:MAG: transposase [Planctomycetota bacterium]